MEYNNYYPGHPPPNQQHVGGPPMQQHPPPQSAGQMMHSPMPPQQPNIRQTMPPGPMNHQQQMQQMQSQQQQQHIGHHTQQLNPQQQQSQQQHPNYQQVHPPHPHGQPVSHSSSPHAQQQQHHQHQQHQHHNHSHQSNMSGPLPQPQAMSQHMHSQSPHHHQPQQHHGGPMHMQQQQQPLNQMVRPQVGPSVMNHPQPGMHQSIHQQNFFGGGPIPQQPNMHHYPSNPHHPNHQTQHHHPPVMHHGPPMTAPHLHQNIGRNSSPYYPSILQTEFRIIELNRRLQCKPNPRHQFNPLPGPYDESIWWEKFASDFFEDDATLTLRMHDDKPVEYTIGRTLIPRFFRSYFTGGVTDLSFSLRNPKETPINPHLITLDCDQAFIITNNIFRHPSIPAHQGVVVHTEGHLVLDFVTNSFDNLSIKSWRFYTRGCREYIDRSILSSMGMATNYLAEPITKHGFTKSTITYLKMCMIMEPMQELMFQNKQTKLDPRSCLRKILFDRYKFRSGEDNRAATNKRRKRKPSGAPAVTNNQTTKKSKSGINNAIGNNAGMNNMMMSPSSAAPNFSLASQDVMVVGEPSMMGGDFGDDNERMITRLENTQYDPTASNQTMADESDSTNAPTSGDMTHTSEELDGLIENHTLPASAMTHQQQNLSPVSQQQAQQQHIQQQQHHHQQQHSVPQAQVHQSQVQAPQTHHMPLEHTSSDQLSSQLVDSQEQVTYLPAQVGGDQKTDQQMSSTDVLNNASIKTDDEENNQVAAYEQQPGDELLQDIKQEQDQPSETAQLNPQNGDISQSQMVSEEGSKSLDEVPLATEGENHQVTEETTMNSISDASADASIVNNVGSVETTGNHSNSVQNIPDDTNSNSQLQCSTGNPKSTIEQQQPVNNGFA